MLRCPWCANPESISGDIELYYDESLCVKKGNTCICNPRCSILRNAPPNADDARCFTHAVAVFGQEYTEDELFAVLLKDALYYKINGGLTFSGGEPFLQLYKAIPLLQRLKETHIHLCTETSLFVPVEYFSSVCAYFDLFYVDLKVLTKDECKAILGGEVDLFFKNLDVLFSMTDQVVYRIPLVEGVTTTEANFAAITGVINKYKPLRVEYFDIHRMAEKKYKMLNRNMPIFEKVSDKTKKALNDLLLNNHVEGVYIEP
jgi:pyruvate formate lyase activating enzyme